MRFESERVLARKPVRMDAFVAHVNGLEIDAAVLLLLGACLGVLVVVDVE